MSTWNLLPGQLLRSIVHEVACATILEYGGEEVKDLQIISRRQKLRRIEVLRAVQREARPLDWFEGRVLANDPNKEDRRQATRDLVDISLIERDDRYPGPGHPHPYRLTPQGQDFMEEVMERIGRGRSIDWKRVKEIEFPSAPNLGRTDDVGTLRAFTIKVLGGRKGSGVFSLTNIFPMDYSRQALRIFV